VALGLTQPVTEMSTRNIPAGNGRPARKADNFATCEPIVWKVGEPRRLTTVRASMACCRDSFTSFFTLLQRHSVQSSLSLSLSRSRHSAVGIVTGYEMDDREVRVQVSAGLRMSFSQRLSAHPAFYPIGSAGSFPGGKAVGASNWPLISN
jgi:hypothetical protein